MARNWASKGWSSDGSAVTTWSRTWYGLAVTHCHQPGMTRYAVAMATKKMTEPTDRDRWIKFCADETVVPGSRVGGVMVIGCPTWNRESSQRRCRVPESGRAPDLRFRPLSCTHE